MTPLATAVPPQYQVLLSSSQEVITTWPVLNPYQPDALDIMALVESGSLEISEQAGSVSRSLSIASSGSEAGTGGYKAMSAIDFDAHRSSAIQLEDFISVSSSLAELAGLPAGWDGADAASLSSVAIAAANNLLFHLLANEHFAKAVGSLELGAPIPDGGIELEWQGPEWRVDIQVAPDGTFGYLLVGGEPGNRVYHEADDLDLESILQVIGSALTNDCL
jgi:hypothetical protein